MNSAVSIDTRVYRMCCVCDARSPWQSSCLHFYAGCSRPTEHVCNAQLQFSYLKHAEYWWRWNKIDNFNWASESSISVWIMGKYKELDDDKLHAAAMYVWCHELIEFLGSRCNWAVSSTIRFPSCAARVSCWRCAPTQTFCVIQAEIFT